MKATMIREDGSIAREFFLPNKAPTPHIIVDHVTNVTYMLTSTGNGYMYTAQEHYCFSESYTGQIDAIGYTK